MECGSFQPNPFKPTHCKDCGQAESSHVVKSSSPTRPPRTKSPPPPVAAIPPPRRSKMEPPGITFSPDATPPRPVSPQPPIPGAGPPRKPLPQRPNKKPHSVMVSGTNPSNIFPILSPRDGSRENAISGSPPILPPPRKSQQKSQDEKERGIFTLSEEKPLMEGNAPHIRTSVPDPESPEGAPELLVSPETSQSARGRSPAPLPPISEPRPLPPISEPRPLPPISEPRPLPPKSEPRPLPPISEPRPLPPISEPRPASPILIPQTPVGSPEKEQSFPGESPPFRARSPVPPPLPLKKRSLLGLPTVPPPKTEESNDESSEEQIIKPPLSESECSAFEDEVDSLVSVPEKTVLIEPPPPPFQPETKREYLVIEILTTERTYVTNLKCLIETFLIPLRGQYKALLISHSDIEILFSNVEDISKINSALLEELEFRLSNWSDTQTIGDAVRRLIPFLKMYRLYTANYEKAQVLLAEIMNKNLNFAGHVKKWESEVVKMDMIPLLSYLILPVQRIPRYNMLLRDMLHQTKEDHPDYENLSKAVDEMENVAIYINDEIQKAEARAKMIEIQYMFLALSGFELVIPSRQLLHQGELIKVCRKAHKPRQFFMFNDGLLYAEIVTARYIFRKFMPLSSLKVKDMPDTTEDEDGGVMQYRNAFVIRSSQKSFIVYASAPEVKQKWLRAVNEALEEREGGDGDSHEAPVWIPDDAVDRCLICRDGFTFLNRRHHCRSCGRVVCASCSSCKLFLGESYAQKVCVWCYEEKFPSDLRGDGEEKEKKDKEKKDKEKKEKEKKEKEKKEKEKKDKDKEKEKDKEKKEKEEKEEPENTEKEVDKEGESNIKGDQEKEDERKSFFESGSFLRKFSLVQ